MFSDIGYHAPVAKPGNVQKKKREYTTATGAAAR